ncbi:MAG: GNAT family N-acetyltransferase [Candidatus Latescibacterota bacterium]|nr:MAG: GNAT family N-acetyltransferase [Candidatus Latescibacterota bacterium]
MPILVSKKYFSLLTKSEVCPPISPETFASDLICRANDADNIIEVMVGALDHFLPAAWELEFHHISECSPVVGYFSNGGSSLFSAVEFDGFGNVVLTTGSFDDYLSSLRPNFARNLRRFDRKIQTLSGFAIETLVGEAAHRGIFDEFLALEVSGWKGRGETAILNHPRQVAFYRDFKRRMRERGWLEWNVLRADGKIVAAHMAAKIDRVLYLWKIAYDEGYKAYAPGDVLMAHTLKTAFESVDTDEVNCLTNTQWNQNWNMTGRRDFNVTVWPKRTLPFVAGYCRKQSKIVLRRIPFVRQAYHVIRQLGF